MTALVVLGALPLLCVVAALGEIAAVHVARLQLPRHVAQVGDDTGGEAFQLQLRQRSPFSR